MVPDAMTQCDTALFSNLYVSPKLKKASAVTHPKGLRKVKIILKYEERKWVSGEECRIIYMNWKVKIFMLHLIRFRTKLKLQSYFTFPSCPVPNTAYGTRAKRTQSTAINQDKEDYGIMLRKSGLEIKVQKV